MKKIVNVKKVSTFLLTTLLATGFVFILQAGFLSACSLDSPDSQDPVKKTVKLSGTIDVTFEDKAVPHVDIVVDTPEQNWFKFASLTSPSPKASWSISLPVFNPPIEISFRVRGYNENDQLLFEETKEFDTPVSVSNKDVSKITLDMGNFATKKPITLSGTINVAYNNQPVHHVEIGVDAPGQDWIAYKRLDSPSPSATWSIEEVPAFAIPTKISFRVQGYDGQNKRLFNETIELDHLVSAFDEDVPGITLDLGNIINNEPRNIIPLEEGKWCEGDIIIPSNLEWYSFDVESGIKYYIWWNDIVAGDGTKMLDIEVNAFVNATTEIPLEDNDNAWETPVSFTATFSGKIYLRVRAINWGALTGTYAVVYSKDSVRPDNSVTGGGEENPLGTEANPIPLTSGKWYDDSLPSSTAGRTIWYSFDVTKGNSYYVWWNDLGEGDDTKTLDIKVDAYYIEDGSRIFAEEDSAWNKSMPFTAASTGKVKLKVVSYFNDNKEGTFAIGYSSSRSGGNVRPKP